MKVLILGAEGMIGRAIYGVLESSTGWDIFGASRRATNLSMSNWVSGVNAYEIETLNAPINSIKPNVVVNCIGLTKHRDEGNQPISAITINALFPHLLAGLCDKYNIRLIHISTDCVFSGKKGCYTELDTPDASDVYGRSKILGELNYPHTITLRTSTIGHEKNTKYGLVEWFLDQGNSCKGFSRAIFSGLPSVFLAKAIRDFVIPRPDLAGLYHVGAEPISKYELLELIAAEYQKSISIEKSDEFEMDRSFSSERFRSATGFKTPGWQEMIAIMKKEKY